MRITDFIRGMMQKCHVNPRREQNAQNCYYLFGSVGWKGLNKNVMKLLKTDNWTTQELNFDGFVEVVRCAKYLANQGIAYRGTTVKKDDKTFDSEPPWKLVDLAETYCYISFQLTCATGS